jgi:ABC-2 type transport system permease protein
MATGVLMLVSGIKLGMSRADLGFYCGSIVLMGGGLTGLALSLGAIFPNFVDHSPAKIVSGFGGTLCLILNFVYILGFLPIFVWPSLRAARPAVGAAGVDGHGWNLMISGVGLVVLTVLVAGVPVFFAIRKIKRLELLGKL